MFGHLPDRAEDKVYDILVISVTYFLRVSEFKKKSRFITEFLIIIMRCANRFQTIRVTTYMVFSVGC